MRTLLDRLRRYLDLPAEPDAWRLGVRRVLLPLAVIGLGVVGAVMLNLRAPALPTNECRIAQRDLEERNRAQGKPTRALECLGGMEPSSLTLELAATAERLSCQLRAGMRGDEPSLDERQCIEARILGLRNELRELDARMLVPLYVAVALLIATWVQLDARPGRERRATVIAVLIAVATLALAALDGLENHNALRLLTAAEASGALRPDSLVMLYSPLRDAHTASLWKWSAAVPWALAICTGMWEVRRRAETWAGRFGLASVALGAVGMLLLGVAVAWAASVPSGWGWQVLLMQWGFMAAVGALVAICLAIAGSRRPR